MHVTLTGLAIGLLLIAVMLFMVVQMARKTPALRNSLKIYAALPTIEELREQMTSLLASAKALQETAGAENRDLTPEEAAEVERTLSAFDAKEIELNRRLRMQNAEQKMTGPGKRVTEAAPTGGNAMPIPDGAKITGGEPNGAKAGTCGFRHMGEYALSVRAAVGGSVDPRLRVLAAGPSVNNAEGTGADGGYLVPPDFRTNILQKVQGEDSLLSLTDQQTTTSNSITLPVDDTTPWQTSGGVQCYWEGEGTQYNQSKAALQSTVIRATKLAAIVPVTDEMVDDAPSLTAFLNRKVPDKMNYKVNDSIINGDGAGKPLGILSSPSLVTQAAEGGQTAGTVNYTNVVKMWSRMYAPLRRKAVWLINQDIEPQLATMTVPAASGVSGPAYLPPGGLASSPNGTLMGRPIIYSEACAAVGTPGDIMLVDLSQYMSLIKSGGIKSDVSIHLWFDYGITAFRFSMRVGGQSWWPSSITRAKSALPLSWAVALASR